MAKKDSYWFRHDSTAGRGLKMRKMAHIYGHWGKGIYWDVCEILRDQSGYKFENSEDSLKMLCDLIGCKEESKFLDWFNDCVRFELFKINKGFFYSEILTSHMEKWETKKGNGGKGGRGNKAKRKLNESEIKPNIIANEKHKITEQNRTEQNRTEQNRIIYDTKQGLKDLENCIEIEDISKNNKITPETVKSLIPLFLPKARLSYPNWFELVEHFKNLVPIFLKEKNPTQQVRLKTSFKRP